MASNHNIDELIAGLYAAAMGGRDWGDVLNAIAVAQGAMGAFIFVLDKASGQVPLIVSPHVSESANREFQSDIVRTDERIAFQQANRHLQITCDYMHIDETGMDRSSHYDWLRRETDTRYYAAAIAVDDDRTMAAMSVFRTRRQGHAKQVDLDHIARLQPHLRRAIGLHLRMGEIQLFNAAAAANLDRATYGVLLIEGSGQIAHANVAATRILAARDALSDTGGRLSALRHGDDAILQAAFDPRGQGATFALPRATGRRPYLLSVTPVGRERAVFGALRPAWLVRIEDPEAAPVVPDAVVRLAFGLTATEARLAACLSQGMSVTRASDELGIALATGRVHLRSLFRKTGTARQGELVALLARYVMSA